MRWMDVYYLKKDFKRVKEILDELLERNPEFKNTSDYAVHPKNNDFDKGLPIGDNKTVVFRYEIAVNGFFEKGAFERALQLRKRLKECKSDGRCSKRKDYRPCFGSGPIFGFTLCRTPSFLRRKNGYTRETKSIGGRNDNKRRRCNSHYDSRRIQCSITALQ